ncbi:MAG: aminoacyl-tRNA hydrolase [Rhodospirillaceae bacterium]|nr:aminoacyl-tRNA hydrolase [Rhodospirillaceae bacterium]
MRLLVGLGNPGSSYEHNRHNIGFMAADKIAVAFSFGPWKARFQGKVCEGTVGSEKTLLLKPGTFMNLSGQAVGEAMRFYKLAPAEVIVLYDELELQPGRLKVKQGGGNAGHNGLKSIDAHIGVDYWRVRLGIGHPGDKNKVSGYVLQDFAKADQAWLEPFLDAITKALPPLVQGDPNLFMTKVALLTKDTTPNKEPGQPADKTNDNKDAK